MSNDAVGLERISKVVGYKLTKGDFKNDTPNLPQRIALLGQANTANQGSLDTNATEVTSAQQAGILYGFGSPIYNMMRILKPIQGEGVGGIPIFVYAQAEEGGASEKELTITPVGTATGNGTHTIEIAGREGVDGVFYDINIVTGDTVAIVSEKISDAVNAVIGSPVSGTFIATLATLTSKWKGLTADEISVTVNLNGTSIGITYGVASITAGSATPSIQGALDQFGNNWNTIVAHEYGTESATLGLLENFNGRPDPDNPTGRYVGIVFKPFIAITGSVADDPTSVTDTRKDDVTIAIAPAPLSLGFVSEASANMTVLFARQAQDNPHLDVSGKSYPDMPTPDSIGSMKDYDSRDAFVKKGSSTVELSNSVYKVTDFVTTYHPDGEIPPQFRYCRNLNLDFNVRFGYFLLEEINVVDHAIAKDDDTVEASKVIKPKQWTQILNDFSESLTRRALIVDAGFMQESITVDISTTNPDRLETFFKYKRSGFARISSTIAEAGFNFGNI